VDIDNSFYNHLIITDIKNIVFLPQKP